ncbi:Penicillin-binding protein 4* [Phycisphaerae bacterium RAS1]|nr:Penicillin-binding protein 4* [Phycisphaerae bacterium RAS1]
MRTTQCLAALAALVGGGAASAQLPVTGRAVSLLSWADANMQSFMQANDIRGGLLAISHNGVIVYQRGFGYHNESETQPMPENALVRIASCTKPFTGAAIQRLATQGVISLEDFAFDLGQAGGGLLSITPFPSLGDARLRNVRVRHLLTHTGGWDRGEVGDWTYEECQIAGDMGVTSPPGRTNTMRWILGQPLQYTPGVLGCTDSDGDPTSCYSNIGYLAAGLIVEDVSGVGLLTYLRQNILTPEMWVPSTDLRQGRTFHADQPAREAYYEGLQNWCVFQSECSGLRCSILVDSPYGSWDHEARVGQGGLVISAATALEFMNRYYVGSGSESIGAPVEPDWSGSHGGSLVGVNCRFWQRGDGTNVFIWFNKRNGDESEANFASQFAAQIDNELDAQSTWPTTAVDGFWVLPGPTQLSYLGSYNYPFRGFAFALTQLTAGSKVNLKPGTDTFVGTISTRMRLSAPLGLARIGG